MLSEDVLLLVHLQNTFNMILEKFDLAFLLFFYSSGSGYSYPSP